MHCHNIPEAGLVAGSRIVLVGHPNVGKSVIFQRLTGQHVTVSNYPGTTVEVARAIFGAKAASVFLLDEEAEELVFEAVAGEGEGELIGMRFPAGNGIAGSTGRVLTLNGDGQVAAEAVGT